MRYLALRSLILAAFFTPSLRAEPALTAQAVHRRMLPTYLPTLEGGRSIKSRSFIEPRKAVIPFRQWNSNNGYCGEVSLIQASMNQGQWMSQYNARLICGTGLSQSGPDGFCEAHHNTPNYNAQVLLENPNPGDQPFASAGQCLRNARLAYELFDYSHEARGMEGFRQYLTWIKAETIAGRQVTIALLDHGGHDAQYDHEVTVTRIGTNHDPRDPMYYDDDVLYFDDHTKGGAPYTQGYTFKSLANTREDANVPSAGPYSILIPGEQPVFSAAGGDGLHDNPHAILPANYGFAVLGVDDRDGVTLPVRLEIERSATNGVPNRLRGAVALNYEWPKNGPAGSCTNRPPSAWMDLRLRATVSGLVPGRAYNCYEYEFGGITGVGDAAALKVPDSEFNAHASEATRITRFVAKKNRHTQTILTTSDKILVVRCVPTEAP